MCKHADKGQDSKYLSNRRSPIRIMTNGIMRSVANTNGGSFGKTIEKSNGIPGCRRYSRLLG